MKKNLVILSRFSDSESFYRDIEKIKKLSNSELKKIIELHLDYENSRNVIDPKLEGAFKDERFHLAKKASFFFGVLFQEGFKKVYSFNDFINELKLLDFDEKTITEIKKIFDEKLKKMIDDMKKIERPLLNSYCDFQWRIIKVKYDWTDISRDNVKIEMKFYVHPVTGVHETLALEMTPLEFKKFLGEVNTIKRELKNVD